MPSFLHKADPKEVSKLKIVGLHQAAPMDKDYKKKNPVPYSMPEQKAAYSEINQMRL